MQAGVFRNSKKRKLKKGRENRYEVVGKFYLLTKFSIKFLKFWTNFEKIRIFVNNFTKRNKLLSPFLVF